MFFWVPNRIISDNGTPFLNKDAHRLIDWYSISHTTSTPYYPKENGHAEASNKRFPKILGKMTKENGKGWKEELPTALWAHRIAKSRAIGDSPFSLVYDIVVVIPIDLVRLTVKLTEIAGIPQEYTLEIMEEMVKIFFLWPSCQTDFVFYKTRTIINKDLYAAISYAIVHNAHAKSK